MVGVPSHQKREERNYLKYGMVHAWHLKKNIWNYILHEWINWDIQMFEQILYEISIKKNKHSHKQWGIIS